MIVSVIVPVYNEEENILFLYEQICQSSRGWGCDYELILVDDGSVDGTLSLLRLLSVRDSRVRYLSFSRNFGHQVAVSAGLEAATGGVAVVLDADLQDPPEVIGSFLQKWREGYKVVYGVRRKRKEAWPKRASYFVFYRILSLLTPIPIPRDSGDFCLMDRAVVDQLVALPERSRFIRGLRAWVGFRQTGVEYERHGRHAGEPKYGWRKLFGLAFDGIVDFSYRPLQISSFLGFAISTISYSPQDVPGFSSLILAVLFLGGIQLVTLGVLGEYLGRMFAEVKRRPLYILKEKSGTKPLPEGPNGSSD
jgi:glycosyltransferase involved in cell wall biosynthesis